MSFIGVKNVGERGAEFRLHGVENFFLRVAEIDGEKHFAGNDVAAVRLVLDQADGADGIGRVLEAMASMRSIMRAAPRSAFLRSRIGVAPVCASWPVTVTSYQRMPCTPWTMPIMRPSSSRIGPCSMCSSNMAPNLRAPAFSSPL